MKERRGGKEMTLAQKLIHEFETLSEIQQIEVVDFVLFLKQKNKNKLGSLMDEVIIENKEALKELAK